MAKQDFDNPPSTDVHGRKRELLKKGVAQGFLDWQDILDELPMQFMGATELEVFLFTCSNLGVEVRGKPDDFSLVGG